MAQIISNTGHDDMIHDAVLDYYGRRLATCASDRTIKIWEIEGDQHKLTDTLKGHEGAVWSLSWAHPKYGTILASASYDGHVFIWRQQPPTTTSSAPAPASPWTKVYDFSLHTASVNLLSWSPHESGCLLACASSDGNVSVLEFANNNWSHVMVPAHGLGANAVSWAPSIAPGSVTSQGQAGQGQGQGQGLRRFVTGGSDCLVKIWEGDGSGGYGCVATLAGHGDWVRDVAWAPTILSKSYIASASQDRTVRIWSCGSAAGNDWTSTELKFESVVWRVSWSLSGNVLAVSTGDNVVSLWKEKLSGGWELVKTIEE